MSNGYDFKAIEAKWQKKWEEEDLYRAKDLPLADRANKFYGLVEFPYPSGEGLHVGHPRSYTAIDIMTRKRRMEGQNVLYPIGWDAFGLPTENFALKHKVKPQDATRKNIANFTRQLKSLGFGFDWSREINTTDPAYYKWTQWMFLKFFNSTYVEKQQRAVPVPVGAGSSRPGQDGVPRMAYKATTLINWCPNCKIGLANEEAQGGVCERCGWKVEKREKAQWMIRITAYAERLLKDLESVDYLEKIKAQQINWIGRSSGATINFQLSTPNFQIPIFTTRPDTLFGATYLVLSPEHEMVEKLMPSLTNAEEVKNYFEMAKRKTELERSSEEKEKTGAELKGIMAINPATGEEIPIWIADYVLASYGTGAIMAVPAHDERDFEFAKKFELSIKKVVRGPASEVRHPDEECFSDEGVAINSGFLDGLSTSEAKLKMTEWLKKEGKGEATVTYKLRDWIFSRQRYWGEPIPIVFCEKCGAVPVPESDLPVLLPDVEHYEPTDTGESPLAAITEWVNTACPSCHDPAKRETDTMPNWAGSSWYFLRYCDSKNDKAFADPEKLKFWMPIDLYNGGMEHTTLHLLYSRFWHKFLWDIGAVPEECGSEPYAKRRSHALILGEGGVKMSKSKGNVVNPDDVVEKYGADVFRTYEMFIGPFDADAPWDTRGIEGVKRFLEKVWRIFVEAQFIAPKGEGAMNYAPIGELEILLHQTIKKVGEDIETMNFNTAVSAMMILSNAFADAGEKLPRTHAESFLKLLAPFAPHMSEELWRRLGHEDSIHLSGWPAYDPSKLQAETFELVIQVNGKVRDRLMVSSEISEEEAKATALNLLKIQAALSGKKPKNVIYVKGRLVSISI